MAKISEDKRIAQNKRQKKSRAAKAKFNVKPVTILPSESEREMLNYCLENTDKTDIPHTATEFLMGFVASEYKRLKSEE